MQTTITNRLFDCQQKYEQVFNIQICQFIIFAVILDNKNNTCYNEYVSNTYTK